MNKQPTLNYLIEWCGRGEQIQSLKVRAVVTCIRYAGTRENALVSFVFEDVSLDTKGSWVQVPGS